MQQILNNIFSNVSDSNRCECVGALQIEQKEMSSRDKVLERHAEIYEVICDHIGKFEQVQFEKIKAFLKNSRKLTPKEIDTVTDMNDLLETLEKNNYFTVGYYTNLLSLFKDNNRIVHDEILQIIKDIECEKAKTGKCLHIYLLYVV